MSVIKNTAINICNNKTIKNRISPLSALDCFDVVSDLSDLHCDITSTFKVDNIVDHNLSLMTGKHGA